MYARTARPTLTMLLSGFFICLIYKKFHPSFSIYWFETMSTMTTTTTTTTATANPSSSSNSNDALRILVVATCSALLLFLFLYFLLQASFGRSTWLSILVFFITLLIMTVRSAYHNSTSFY